MKPKYISCEDVRSGDQSVRWEIHNNNFLQKDGDDQVNGRWFEKFVQTSLPISEDTTDTERYLKEMITHPTDEQIINHLREKVFWSEIEENFSQTFIIVM